MSVPQCPAVLLIARHAETTYGSAAYVGRDDGRGRLTAHGREQAEALAAAVANRRIAAVYTSTLGRAMETGAIVAAHLGVRCAPLGGVQECGDDEAETSVLQRFRAALEEVADQHRGETVLVISHGGAMSVALPRLCANAADELSRVHRLPHGAWTEVQIGAEGWWLTH